MATFRGRAVRAGAAGGQLATGETPRARAIRERARQRRGPRSITGMAAIEKAFPGNSTKQATVWAAVRKLRSNSSSDLYTMPKTRFLAKFRAAQGMAYPYRVPTARV